MSVSRPDPSAGKHAGTSTYEELFELGRGGMGSAHLAYVMGFGGFERLVVLKRLRQDRAQGDRAVQRLLAEARIAASIHHANVVATQRVDVDAQGPYLVLDYVEGASLGELDDRTMLHGDPIPVPICLRVALDALSGLTAIHEARDSRGRKLSILHRDLSLQNMLVGRDGVTRVSDFGIAKSAFGAALTDEGYLVGKLQYLPPEYLRQEVVGPTMDVYALGVTLWLALTGRNPWPKASDAQLMHAILTEGVPPISCAMVLAPAIEQLVQRACAPDASQRFASARAMADEIERINRETGWMATHREVAEWTEGLVGPDLERRRELVSSLLQKRRGSGKPAPHGPNVETHPIPDGAAWAEVKKPRRSVRPGPSHRALALALLVLSPIAVAVALPLIGASKTSDTPPSTAATAADIVSTSIDGAALSSSQLAAPSVTPVPTESVSTPTPERSAKRWLPAVRSPSAPRSAPPSKARAPDDIRAKNPYRH